MTRQPDRPGPHPENQIKRVEVRRPRHALEFMLVAVAAVMVVGAVLGRIGGSLALIVAGSHATAAIVLVVQRKIGRRVALIAALIAIVWAVANIAVAGGVRWLPGGLIVIGLFEAMLVAGSTPRRDPDRKLRPR